MKLSHVFEQFPTLESEQLLLKKIEVSNLNEVFGIYSNDQVFEYCGIIPKHNKDTVKNMIGHFERDFTKGVRVKWGIFLKNNPYILLGIIEVMDFNQKVDMVTIGYFLAEPYWGKGIAAQAIQLVVKYLFETAEVNRIQAEVMPFNERSKRVLLKNGFTKEGTLRQAHVWSGKGLVDLEIYSILAEEYFASIGKLRVSNRM
ncbi:MULTISPECIES: GNAT family protein [Paenibacillus]|uniref:GNAT family N-acetyltransferase n=1 Tax=Paenibacillus TaxID=44249 RepID=UPI00096FD142|nr:GNAT family protein [Paenibacillus odorifer]OMD60779.1 alanine acetyltransferase [Paenibacillus odorifer]